MAPDEIISSTRNPAVQAAARLHRSRHRRETGSTLLEGPTVVAEAVTASHPISEVFVLDGELPPAGVTASVHVVTESVMGRLAGTATPRGPVAVAAIPPPSVPAESPLLVVWGVSDPGNCGTLLRTAAAFGYGYVSGPGSADPWAPKVVRSAAGGHFHTTVGSISTIEALAGRELIGTVPTGGEPPGAVSARSALLVGSEAHGLPEEILAACARVVSIPMRGGTESLNAAVAGGIVAYFGTLSSED